MKYNRLEILESALNFVTKKIEPTNTSYLSTLAEFIGTLLELDYVLIDKYSKEVPDIAETVAIYTTKGFTPNIKYNLEGTPCHNVIGCKLCTYNSNVKELFPNDSLLVEMNVDSYIGIPLWDNKGEAIGLIAVMDSKLISDSKTIELALQVIAAKASLELEKIIYENKLKLSSDRINNLLESSEDIITVHNNDGTYLYYNGPSCYAITPEEIVGKSPQDLFSKNEASNLIRAFNKVVKTGKSETLEVLLDWLGEKRWFSEYIYPIRNTDGEIVELVKVCRDIHKRKIAEQELEKANKNAEKSEKHFRDLFESSPVAIWEEDFSDVKKYIDEISNNTTDFEFYINSHHEAVMECVSKIKILNVNKAAIELYGASSKANLLEGLGNHFTEESYNGVKKQLIAIHQNKNNFQTDSEIITENKVTKQVQLKYTVAPGYESNYEKVYVSLIDITNRKNAERKLFQANELLNQAQALSNVGSWQWNMITDKATWSDEMYKIYGVEKGVFYPSNENVTKTIIPEDLPKVSAAIGELFEKEKFTPIEFRILRPTNEIRHVYIMALERGEKGSANENMLFGVTQDITERKLTEKSLHQFAHIASSSTDHITIINKECKYSAINDEFAKSFGLTSSQIIGHPVADIMGDKYFKTTVKENIDRCLKGDQINYQAWFDYPVKGKRFMDVKYSQYIDKGNVIGVVINARDITERKLIDDKIQNALDEKELLLRELYHRTKNNMQVISSMLSIQAFYNDNKVVKEVFNETTNRILGMALVHEKLYQHQDLSWIDLKEYIIELIELIKTNMTYNTNHINLLYDLQSVKSTIDTAIPCGLIVNELFSNAMKHSFNGREKGEIHIKLLTDDENFINLSVSDNGIGIPEKIDIRNTKSYGLQAVFGIVEHQLGGEIEIISSKENGTKISIKIKNNQQKARV